MVGRGVHLLAGNTYLCSDDYYLAYIYDLVAKSVHSFCSQFCI